MNYLQIIKLVALTAIIGCKSKQLCSTVQIASGQSVPTGDGIFQSTVALYLGDTMGASCSAVIISSNQVLTAAHCIDVMGPGSQIRTGDPTNPTHKLKTLSTKVPPMWIKGSGSSNIMGYGDIGIVEFEGTLPAGFTAANFAFTAALTINQPVTIAGYGKQNNSDPKANHSLSKVTVFSSTNQWTNDTLLFTSPTGASACPGDSGGPAFIEQSGKLALIGVSSRGHCAQGQSYYTDVRKHKEWIEENLKTKPPLFENALSKQSSVARKEETQEVGCP